MLKKFRSAFSFTSWSLPTITKNGEGDLVVMSIETYAYREEMLDLREKLLEAEATRISGAKTYTIKEVSEKFVTAI